MAKKVIVIGTGFAGLSAAAFMAQAGWEVTVVEKHDRPGGRARRYSAEGFTFDMGPSWYWMPDVFDRFFAQFGKKTSDYYALKRLDPSYRVYWPEGPVDIPADYEKLKALFAAMEPGADRALDRFMEEAAYKYQVGIQKLVFKPGQSLTEFLDLDLFKGLLRLDVFQSMKAHVGKYFQHPQLRELMEFPVLFLGALPEKTPALYSLMNYADIKGGTWYPEGGMYAIVEAMYQLNLELGVQFCFDTEVSAILTQDYKALGVACKKGSSAFAQPGVLALSAAKEAGTKNVETEGAQTSPIADGVKWPGADQVKAWPEGEETQNLYADVIIGGADYHHIETQLLPPHLRSYSLDYWEKRVMAPSCLLYYVGLDRRLPGMPHHSLFFDTDFAQHGAEIYTHKTWPKDPLFYLSVTSATDDQVAPEGGENLFLLVPVATGLEGDTPERRDHYFNLVMQRLEKHLGLDIRPHVVYCRSFAQSEFVGEYHSFKGNAYGLANTLTQTAVLKPACRSKKLENLFFTGQLTVPGPGVPPSLISGEVVAGEVCKSFGSFKPSYPKAIL